MAQAVDYGIDCLDATGAEVSDVDNLLQDILRAVSTPADIVQVVDGVRAPLNFWEQPPVSFDLRDYCNDSVSQATIAALAGRIEAIYDNDDRFASLTADVSYAQLKLSVAISAVSSSGLAFTMTVVADTSQVEVTSVQS